ncbi:MAG: thioredoxin [Actinomycetota bacterium]|nr:thioredoxin [Actinomycetota bacterium]
MANLAAATDDNFTAEVLDSDLPVLVDFWAEWCGPCHLVSKEVEAIAGELSGRLKVMKLDIDSNPATTSSYGVLSIPSLLLFVDGQEKTRVVGARPSSAILAAIEDYLPAPAQADSSSQ